MRTFLFILLSLFFSSLGVCQKTKKVILKKEIPDTKETFYVLKSDENVKHGSYTKSVWGDVLIKGQFTNNVRAGNWEYYSSNGELVHKYSYTTNLIEFGKPKFNTTKLDSAKLSRPSIILGGLSNMYKSVGRTMRYPNEARRYGIQGKVLIKVTVSKEGKLITPRVVEGIGYGCDEEAIRVINLLDQEWLPALDLDNEPVEVELTFPITFKLG